jgi:predicted nuclease with TOPRIM domain
LEKIELKQKLEKLKKAHDLNVHRIEVLDKQISHSSSSIILLLDEMLDIFTQFQEMDEKEAKATMERLDAIREREMLEIEIEQLREQVLGLGKTCISRLLGADETPLYRQPPFLKSDPEMWNEQERKIVGRRPS